MIRNSFYLMCSLFLFLGSNTELFAQETENKEAGSAYDLLSSYYDKDFKPFSKGSWYTGLSFTLRKNVQQDNPGLLQTVLEGEQSNFSIHLKAGHYTGDYFMAGFEFDMNQSSFLGTVVRDADTIQSNTISRGYGFTPNVRSSFPLTPNERLSFFTIVGARFGIENGNTRETKHLDEVQKSYSSIYSFYAGVSPGITFFAMENFAFEIRLDVIGYHLTVTEKTKNDGSPATVVSHNVNFNINLLTLEMGISYYF